VIDDSCFQSADFNGLASHIAILLLWFCQFKIKDKRTKNIKCWPNSRKPAQHYKLQLGAQDET